MKLSIVLSAIFLALFAGGCVANSGDTLPTQGTPPSNQVKFRPSLTYDGKKGLAFIGYDIKNQLDLDICVPTSALGDNDVFELSFKVKDKRGRILRAPASGFLPPFGDAVTRVRSGETVKAAFQSSNRLQAIFTEKFIRDFGPFKIKTSLRTTRCDDGTTLISESDWQDLPTTKL